MPKGPKQCPPGKVVNPKTGRCKKQKTFKFTRKVKPTPKMNVRSLKHKQQGMDMREELLDKSKVYQEHKALQQKHKELAKMIRSNNLVKAKGALKGKQETSTRIRAEAQGSLVVRKWVLGTGREEGTHYWVFEGTKMEALHQYLMYNLSYGKEEEKEFIDNYPYTLRSYIFSLNFNAVKDDAKNKVTGEVFRFEEIDEYPNYKDHVSEINCGPLEEFVTDQDINNFIKDNLDDDQDGTFAHKTSFYGDIQTLDEFLKPGGVWPGIKDDNIFGDTLQELVVKMDFNYDTIPPDFPEQTDDWEPEDEL